MKKRLITTLFLLAGSSASFAADHGNHAANKELNDQSHQPKTVSHKRMKRPQIEGLFSVDLVKDSGQLHLLTGRAEAGKKSLWYRHSSDGGKSWSVESQLLSDNNLAVRASRGNDAQIVAQGEAIVATWTQFDPDARFNAGPMMAARSTDQGESWQAASAPPDWHQGSHGFSDLSSDSQFMHAVWLDSRKEMGAAKGRQGVRYARSADGGLSWESNITVDAHSCSCCWNTIKSDGEGNSYVLYRDKEPSDLSIGVVNSQQQWTYLGHVGAFDWQFEGCPHIGGGLAFQGQGEQKKIHAVAGTGHPEKMGVYYLRSVELGKRWSAPFRLGDETALHADLAAQENGHIIAVWDMMGSQGLAIFMAESRDSGLSWSEPTSISGEGMRASHPKIVAVEAGFLVVWTESDGKKQSLIMERFER